MSCPVCVLSIHIVKLPSSGAEEVCWVMYDLCDLLNQTQHMLQVQSFPPHMYLSSQSSFIPITVSVDKSSSSLSLSPESFCCVLCKVQHLIIVIISTATLTSSALLCFAFPSSICLSSSSFSGGSIM